MEQAIQGLESPGFRLLLHPAGVLDGESYFREILERLPAAVYATDADGRILFYNDAAAALWGRRPKMGEDWWCGSWRLYWPDGTPMAHGECPMAVTLRTGRPVRGAEAIAERPDGSRFPFIPYPTPLHDACGKLVGAVNRLVDITDR
jgi:PAS domain S-box-containing protein